MLVKLSIILKRQKFWFLIFLVYIYNYYSELQSQYHIYMMKPARLKSAIFYQGCEESYFNSNYSSNVTIISLYFDLKNSKHSAKKYAAWIRNMLNSIDSVPLALVVNKRGYRKIKKMRLVRKAKFYIVENIWTILKQIEKERNRSYLTPYLKHQWTLDREAKIHNPSLYAIWNLKSYISFKISYQNPFNSSFFIYSDIGSFRKEVFPNWPDVSFISDSLKPKLRDKILLGQIEQIKTLIENQDTIGGGFFAGTSKAIRNFYFNFYTIHDKRLEEGLFIGKDQTTMSLLTFRYFNRTVKRLKAFDFKCGDKWFFYVPFLSRTPRDHCIEDRLSLILEK